MVRIIFSLILPCIVGLGCHRGVHNSTSDIGYHIHNKNNLAQAILDVHNRKFIWMEQKTLDSLQILLHDDVQYIHSNGWNESKSDVMHNLKSGKLSYDAITVMESDAKIVDNTAIITGKGQFNVSLEGKSISITLGYTEVYVIKNNTVRLVSRHACKI